MQEKTADTSVPIDSNSPKGKSLETNDYILINRHHEGERVSSGGTRPLSDLLRTACHPDSWLKCNVCIKCSGSQRSAVAGVSSSFLNDEKVTKNSLLHVRSQ